MNLDRICIRCVQFPLVIPVSLALFATGCGSRPVESSVVTTKNPLVAQYNVSVSGAAQAWVEFGPDTNYGRQTSQYAGSAAGIYVFNILVAGMTPSSTYHMRAHVQWATGSTWMDEDRTFTTGPLPTSQPVPQILASRPVSGTTASVTLIPGIELLSLAPPNGVGLNIVAADLLGNVIWFCPIGAVTAKPMQNGHYLINAYTDLLEVDLTCSTIRDVSVAQVNQSLQANGYDFTIPPNQGLPGGGQFHHDVLVLPNGHWIALCQIAKSFSDLSGYPGTTNVVGDALVDIDLNGNVVWAWSAFDHLDANRHPYFGLPDWTHSNAVVDTQDGNLLLSMRAQSWILKIDYANGSGTGDILWKLGEEGDLTLLGGDPSQWFYAQHYPSIMSVNGSLTAIAIYDDGNFRTYSDGTVCGSSASAPACYSRATIFQVDESTMLATLLWEDTPGFFSPWGGSIGALSNGDIEFDSSSPNSGPVSQIMEVTQTDGPQIVWQMSISGANAYRGYRIPSLYPGVTWTQ